MISYELLTKFSAFPRERERESKRLRCCVTSFILILLLLLQNFLFFVTPVYASTSPWIQSNWIGGSEQTSWSDTTKYSSGSSVTTSTSNQITLTKQEKFTNTTFDTDLTGWNTGSYLLNDQFTTDISNINGTSAEPGPGTRTETDTNSKISISSSVLNFATGEATNDGVWYGLQPRTAGMTLMATVTPADTNGVIAIGWDSDASGAINDALQFASSGALKIVQNGGTAITVGVYTATAYQVAIQMGSTGIYWYIKGGAFTNWELLWVSTSGSGAGYPSITSQSTTSIFTVDNVRVFTQISQPKPLAYDTFTRANNPIGTSESVGPDGQVIAAPAWAGSTYTISNNKAINTPTLGSEMVVNGDMETGDPPSSWTAANGGVLSSVLDEHTGGSGARSINVQNSAVDTGRATQSIVATGGTWLFATGWLRNIGGNSEMYIANINNNVPIVRFNGSGANWLGPLALSGRAGGNITVILKLTESIIGRYARWDEISVKPITLSTLFGVVNTSQSDAITSADITVGGMVDAAPKVQAGIVVNLDSTSSPSNFVIAYHDGTNIHLEKSVAGTYTSLINTAVAYSAGANLKIIKDGTSFSVYYNNALVDTPKTISDLGIISNTLHGIFSTYSGSTFDNFSVWNRNAAPQSELIATHETTTKLNGAGASKLISTDGNGVFVQSVNVGDTSTYNFIANVYTNGSVVNSNDVQLYYNGSTISTTYTAIDDSPGWYSLTGTIAGVNAARDYGVEIKDDKTVYLDDLSLYNYPSSGSLTSSIFDSGQESNWGILAYLSTVPTNTALSVKIRTSNNSGMTGATVFSSCSEISSGLDISSNSCVSDGQRYVQYEISLSNTDLLATPIFTNFSLPFVATPANTSSNSSSSSSSSFSPSICTASQPTGTTPWLYSAVSNSDNSVTLRFTNYQTLITHFVIEYGTKSGDYKFSVDNIDKNATSYIINSLSPNTTYYFRVRAGNDCATGSWSNEISTKTKGSISFNQLDFTESELTPVEDNTTVNSCQAYTVKSGDSLWSIASNLLGDGSKYTDILEQNKDTYSSLKTSSSLQVGWELKINCDSSKSNTGANNDNDNNETNTGGYEVNIKVVNTDKEPVKGAKVTLHSNPRETTTDKDGIAHFTGVESGDHKVLIAYNNFEGEQSINLSGDTKEFNLNITVTEKKVVFSKTAWIVIGIMGLVIASLIFVLLKRKGYKQIN